MGEPGHGLRSRIANAVLGLAFEPSEREEILRDVEELCAGRGGRARAYWALVCSYPLAEWGERLRSRLTRRSPGGGVGTMWQDVRTAARGLRRRPGFTITAVTILGMGIGAVISMQSVVDGVLLAPLPMEEPDRLVSLWTIDARGRRTRMTPGNVGDVAELTDVFASVTAFQQSEATLVDPEGGPNLVLRGGAVTWEYFRTLGITPVHGRDFEPADMDADSEPTVVLSHHVWRSVFGGDPSIVGRHIEIGQTRTRVIGIVPPGLHPTAASVDGTLPFTGSDADYFRVFQFAGNYWSLRQPHLLGGIARLADGTDVETAAAALATLSDRLGTEFAPNRDERIVAAPLREEIVGDTRPALLALLAAVGIVLLIAAVNVGALFVLRAEDRLHEVDLMRALGVPAGRVTRQRLAEAGAVCALAVGVGLAVSTWLVEALKTLVPYSVPRLRDVTVAPSAVALAMLAAVALTLVFGLVPTRMRAAARAPGTRRATAAPRRRRAASALVGVQACFAVVVIAWAMLLSRSLTELRRVDLGFEGSDTWVFSLRDSFGSADEILAAVRGVPGVRSAALTYDHPLERWWEDGYVLEDAAPDANVVPLATIRPFGEGYLETIGLAVLEGRAPDALDFSGAVRMALVNESFRARHRDAGSLVGRRVLVPSAERRLAEGEGVFEIVGVVEDVRFLGPAAPSEPAIYVPLPHFAVQGSTVLARGEPTMPFPVGAVRAAIAGAAPEAGIDEAASLDELLERALARPRFNSLLLALMSGVVMLLCSLGVYGLVSRTVVTRQRELAIRVAVGAAGATVTRSVVQRALAPLAVGALVGIAPAALGSRALGSLLFEVSPTDALSLTSAPLLLALVGAVAALVPARRILSLDPSESLKAE